MNRTTISAAIIAKNEADRIGHLLGSLGFVDEIVVVDSGSTDETVKVCLDAGAKVVFHPWQGFARQKQVAMNLTTSQWVLNLDADEVVSEALAQEIQTAIRSASADVDGFEMPRLSKYLGRWIRHGGWYPDWKLRLARRENARWEAIDLHEKLVVDGKVRRLLAPLHHHVYRNISDQIQTIDRYSTLQASMRKSAGPVFVLLGVAHAFGKFIECYLWKGGLFDGIPGVVIAMNSSWYVFLKHAKAWEVCLEKKQKEPPSRC